MIRPAKLEDVPVIRQLINSHAEEGRMLFRSMADIYERLRDFQLYEKEGQVVGCCALQILWKDLAEVKSLAVRRDCQGRGIGSALVQAVKSEAGQLHLPRIFTLTMEKDFFEKMGFVKIPMSALPMKVWSDCVNCPKQDHCDEIAMEYRFYTHPS